MPPNGTPMQLRNNVNGRKKRKATTSPETVRDTKVNTELDVSFHQVSGRAFEADPVDENESEVDSDVNDGYSSQDDLEEGNCDSKKDVSKCELTVSSDHFSTNRFALLSEESESLMPLSSKSEFNLPADAKPVSVTRSDSPTPNTTIPTQPKCVKCCHANIGPHSFDFCHDNSLDYVHVNDNGMEIAPMIYCVSCADYHHFNEYCYKRKAKVVPPL